jgi:hypothetical protein
VAGAATPTPRAATPLVRTPRVTPALTGGEQLLTLTPRQVDVGWWASAEPQRGSIGDSFLYAGLSQGQAYVSALRFDLRRIARGTEIREVSLHLTGLRAPQVDPDSAATWGVQLIAESDLAQLPSADFFAVFGAPAAVELQPLLTVADIGVGVTNRWTFDDTARAWLFQQILDGAASVIVRIAPLAADGDTLFAWDSGQGPESRGDSPELVLQLGPPPPTPPPTPTRPVIVATFTPVPDNVLTVVAMTMTPPTLAPPTATSVPATATPTPVPPEIVTPTPVPQNLATVQAAAIAAGLPPVVLDTPVPANAATAAADAAYATAVALTTGTFTPVPTNYVTPALYYPSPPPENVATAAAQALAATEAARSGTPTPTLPWNAVPVIYAFATATPASREAAIALIEQQNAMAATTGTPTPTPWNLVVITPVPQPTPTPIPLVVPATNLTPTPTPTPTIALSAADFVRFQGKILFLSNRLGGAQTWVMHPDTGEVLALVTDPRIHTLARDYYLANSPDGKERAIVVLVGLEDQPDNFQIQIENLEFGTKRHLTYFPRAANYDPAWSPKGDRIAFVSTLNGGDDIYTLQPDGEGLMRLTENTWEWDKHPTWSPDGSRIAFFSNRDTGRRQIWVMNADGSDQRNLSQNEFEDWDPVWVR